MGTNIKYLKIYNKIIFSRSIQIERPANIVFLKRKEIIKMKVIKFNNKTALCEMNILHESHRAAN